MFWFCSVSQVHYMPSLNLSKGDHFERYKILYSNVSFKLGGCHIQCCYSLVYCWCFTIRFFDGSSFIFPRFVEIYCWASLRTGYWSNRGKVVSVVVRHDKGNHCVSFGYSVMGSYYLFCNSHNGLRFVWSDWCFLLVSLRINKAKISRYWIFESSQ